MTPIKDIAQTTSGPLRPSLWLGLPMTFGFLCALGCGGGGGSTPSAMPSPAEQPTRPGETFSYPSPALVFTKGQAPMEIHPTRSFPEGASYSVEPDLPAGLSLNPTTGTLSGTPAGTATETTTTHVVTAYHRGTSAKSTLTITIQESPSDPMPSPPAPSVPNAPPTPSTPATPSQLKYNTSTEVYTLGKAIRWVSPDYLGTVTAFSVSPDLPLGLALDSATGILRGTPRQAASRAAYQVTASNSGGSCSTVLFVEVKEALATPAVVLAPMVTSGRRNLIASISNPVPGGRYVWTVSGGTMVAGQNGPTLTFAAGPVGTLEVSATLSRGPETVVGRATTTVVPAPSATITAPTVVHPEAEWMRARVAKVEGLTYRWSLRSASTEATLEGATDSDSVAFFAGAKPGRFRIAVEAVNPLGEANTSELEIEVKREAWVDRGGRIPAGQPSPAGISATLLPDGRVLVLGGPFHLPGQDSGQTAVAAIYAPKTNLWTATRPPKHKDYRDHTACLIRGDKILLMGVTPAGMGVESYDPVLDTWTEVAQMKTPRRDFTATVFGNGGKVLVAGGRKLEAKDYVVEAEVYDVNDDTWTDAGVMHHGRRATAPPC